MYTALYVELIRGAESTCHRGLGPSTLKVPLPGEVPPVKRGDNLVSEGLGTVRLLCAALTMFFPWLRQEGWGWVPRLFTTRVMS